ncbi:MAG: RNA polymerase sigma factor [Planctomycetota bacterium]|nr:RNA polymerase sigma factor [Planctomycetota bacterium]
MTNGPGQVDPQGRSDADPDAAAVVAAQSGDRAALAALLRRHESQLFAMCVRMVGDRETARDLTQDAMVRVIEALDRFDGRARFSTWATRIAINLCLSHLRKQKLRRHPSLDAPLDPTSQKPSWTQTRQTTEPGPAGSVEHREELVRLEAAMAELDAEQRTILVLRDVRDLDYRQIAETLEVAVGTVKSRLFRARSALREAMERLEERGE